MNKRIQSTIWSGAKGALSFLVAANVFAGAAPTDSAPSVEETMKTLLTVYEQIGEGSMQSLNQIGHAYFDLAEKASSTADKVKHYEKASEAFVKAADAGCAEAIYNAGLAFNKLGELAAEDAQMSAQHNGQAAKFYRLIVSQQKVHKDLALKAAINLAILVLNAKVQADTTEIAGWIDLAKEAVATSPKKAKSLMDTSMAILLKMSSPDAKATTEPKPETVEGKTPATMTA